MKNDKYKKVIGVEKKTENDTPPAEDKTPPKNRLVMRPEILALHALCCLCRIQKVSEPLIQRHRLIELFQTNLGANKFKPEDYIVELEKYREWLDKHIVYLQDSEGDLDYAFRDNTGTDDEINRMKQFQTMLHVSSGEAQEWVLKAYFASNRGALSYDALRKMENSWHKKDFSERGTLDSNNLCYGKIFRYWFWKLDFLLWELHQREENNDLFADLNEREREAISGYRFRDNISIEHLHPQSKEDEIWGDRDDPEANLHKFGNLAMMSQSANSAQSDDGIGTKFGRVKDWLNTGRLESIKMLLMYHLAERDKEGWTVDKADKHEKSMIDILESDFKQHMQTNEPTEESGE
ncbi:MAG: DUF1524 domain-containing protein [Victivallales bacterium]|nr:DUF1524 domain-containing protein [Victivallales bacterium]MBQ6474173.1 DUF1524 domain-containing protein [Victivallales bacterium]